MLGVRIRSSVRYPLAIGTLALLSRKQESKVSLEGSSSANLKRPRDYPLPPPPEEWPQRPLWVRATPGSSTRILRVRRGNNALNEDGGIPINNGSEAPGESTLIDFESDHFKGTLLLLLRGAPSQSDSTNNYFDNRQQTWHGVVRGRFKESHELQTCVTGQVFRRPAGRLLPHWLMQRLVHPLINRLAPHNAMDLECQQPYYWAPLAHMAQTVVVNHSTSLPSVQEMEQELERTEPPPSNPQSILYEITQQQHESRTSQLMKRLTTSKLIKRLTAKMMDDHTANTKARKKLLRQYFDGTLEGSKVYWSPEKEYTFGVYNGWVLFHDPNDIALDLRLPFCHHISLPARTDGQPIVFMSAILGEEEGVEHLNYLWSFEIWHESLYPAAKEREMEFLGRSREGIRRPLGGLLPAIRPLLGFLKKSCRPTSLSGGSKWDPK